MDIFRKNSLNHSTSRFNDFAIRRHRAGRP
jgi:hypothetical protein